MMTEARALETLGLACQPSEADLREAYLTKVKKYPPDSHGDRFQEIRSAYEYLKDPRARARRDFAVFPESLSDLWPDGRDNRQFVGPEAWLKAMSKG